MGDIKKVIEENVRGKWGKPVSSFKIVFDSQQAQHETIYYWLLDFIQGFGFDTKKITDNFMSSPGSGHFTEMGQRATRLQEEGMKILGGLNQVVKSALNLIYDLKEFEIRLSHYDDYHSNDEKKKKDALISLKQIWLDNVDIKKVRGSILQMSMDGGFSTLREVFMIAESVEHLKRLNDDKYEGLINDQVMRILIPRLSEFFKWIEYSEKELRKRMNIEKNYLKSQVETIKLYSQWMKPYLENAEKLRQKGFEGDAALVNAFSTSMFQLTLLAKKAAKVPERFGEDYKLKRDYHSCLLVDLKYRGHVSQRLQQQGDYVFGMGGRVEITFDSYALNSEELELVNKKLTGDEVGDTMKFSMNLAEEALKELKEDLDHFLNGDKDKKKKEEEDKEDDINPFSALFGGMFKRKEEKEEEEKEIKSKKDIKKDNFVEKEVREKAAETAASRLYTLYDVYKKAHGMASTPEDFDNEED